VPVPVPVPGSSHEGSLTETGASGALRRIVYGHGHGHVYGEPMPRIERPYPLIPVVAIPLMNVFCVKKNSTMIGTMSTALAAIKYCHCTPPF